MRKSEWGSGNLLNAEVEMGKWEFIEGGSRNGEVGIIWNAEVGMWKSELFGMRKSGIFDCELWNGFA